MTVPAPIAKALDELQAVYYYTGSSESTRAARKHADELIAGLVAERDGPIDMVLHCPNCGLQHVDAPEPTSYKREHDNCSVVESHWCNPWHRSHLCHGCGHIWRPADVPTNGVAAVKTAGKNDSPIDARATKEAP